MPILDRLETRFGRFAIPGLIQAIAALQLLTLILALFLPPESQAAYLDFLKLDAKRLFEGEVWRLVTYIFIPGTLRPLYGALAAWFLMWLGRGLDEAWGAFRVNAYVLGGMIPQAAATLLMNGEFGTLWITSTVLFAAAMIYPNEEILLFFILPVKLKWLAWFDAALLAFMMFGSPMLIPIMVLGHLNFLIAFGPAFLKGRVHMAKVSQRRRKYEEASLPEDTYFHRCHVCGKTDVDDPSLDFRVTDAGEEICSKCRQLRAIS
jgi:hypothetical protein